MQEHVDIDYEFGRMALDELIPYGMEYYLGIKELGDLEGEDEESFDDDEEEDEEEVKKPAGKK